VQHSVPTAAVALRTACSVELAHQRVHAKQRYPNGPRRASRFRPSADRARVGAVPHHAGGPDKGAPILRKPNRQGTSVPQRDRGRHRSECCGTYQKGTEGIQGRWHYRDPRACAPSRRSPGDCVRAARRHPCERPYLSRRRKARTGWPEGPPLPGTCCTTRRGWRAAVAQRSGHNRPARGSQRAAGGAATRGRKPPG
jgi:hypothetical protein